MLTLPGWYRGVLGRQRQERVLEIGRAVRCRSHAEIAAGRLSFRHVAVEDFELEPGERPYDMAFAVRVGALDGRHPETGHLARERIRRALVEGGCLYIDGGDPMRELVL